jgi:hypothetical protein
MGQGRAPFLPMPFLGVAATMRVRLGGEGGIVVVVSGIFFILIRVGIFVWMFCLMGWFG